jgi:predicted adenylyl cyclase CyaB
MARNVEIKARVQNPAQLEAHVQSIADRGPLHLVQDDVFYNCPNGRLKLRVLSPTKGELIFYQRSDQTGPKESQYVIAPTAEPAVLHETLSLALGVHGRVQKKRTVFHVGNTRIHLDEVEQLGSFMELEVVLFDHQTIAEGVSIADRLMAQLGIDPPDLIDKAYVDLLPRDRYHPPHS